MRSDFSWSEGEKEIADFCKIPVQRIEKIELLGIASDESSSWGIVVCTDPEICRIVLNAMNGK